MGEKTDRNDWDKFWVADTVHKKLSWSKRRILKMLDRYVRPGMAALDAGCGSGFFSKYFLSRQAVAYALDYSAEALAVAREVTGGAAAGYLQVDLMDTAWAGEYACRFDLIFSDGLFEHFEPAEQDAIFANLLTTLADGGRIVTVVPNRWSMWEVIRPLMMPGIKEKPFTLRRLRRLYASNGATIIESGGINVLPCALSPEPFASTFGMLLFCIGSRAPGNARP